MNNKKTIALALALIAGVGIAGSAYAYQGDYTKTGPNYSPEREAAMETTFANLDYNVWKELMDGRGRVTEVINKENFAKFVEARNLAKNGNIAEADAIRKELGLRTSDGERVGAGRHYGWKSGQRRGRHGENRQTNFIDENGDGICDNLNK